MIVVNNKAAAVTASICNIVKQIKASQLHYTSMADMPSS